MYSYEDMLNRMREGATTEDLAKELAELLNKAEATYNAEQEAFRWEENFENACEDAANALNNALDIYGGWKNIDMSLFLYDGKMVREIIEGLLTGHKFVELITDVLREAAPTKKNRNGDVTFDEALAKFFKDNNII